MALGILELVCTIGLIVPAALRWRPRLTILAATLLAIESLAFVGVHFKYHEVTALILSGVLGLKTRRGAAQQGRTPDAVRFDAPRGVGMAELPLFPRRIIELELPGFSGHTDVGCTRPASC